jgi:hypothetical protein
MMEDPARMEEAARAAMRAVAGTVADAPPLRLAPPLDVTAPHRRRDRGPGRARGHGRRRAQWLAPLAAAACVIAVAAGLVAVRAGQHPSPPPLSSSAMPAGAVPDYYVALSHPPDTATPNQAIVGNAVTGQVLSRISPPAGTTFAGVAGAANDRTFVLETQPFPQPLPASTEVTVRGDGYIASAAAIALPRTWYLLRVNPSAGAAQLVRIPVPTTPAGQEVTALALSPDGSKLALAILPQPFAKGYMGVGGTLQLLRVYSVASGAVLRNWSTTTGSIDSYDFTPDSGTTMSWLPDGNQLAVFIDSDSPGLRVLDVRAPGGDLATAGTRLTTGDISNCSNSPTGYAPLLLAPGGTTLVCGWYDSLSPDSFGGGPVDGGGCAATTVLAGIADYSLSAPEAAAAGATWRPWRASPTLVSYRLPRQCAPSKAMPQLVWSSPKGDNVVAYLPSPGPGWALYHPGGFTRLHVTSVPDPHYVAW